jgi:hypothetical protein
MRRKRRGRYRGFGEVSLGVKIAVGAAVAVIFAVAMAAWFFGRSLYEADAAIDKQTYCPKSGPTSVTVVLIDRTDGINETQAAALRNFFDRWRDEVPVHGAFRVYDVAGGEALPEPILSVCNPADLDNSNDLYGNAKFDKERYQDLFEGPIDALIDRMKSAEAAESSPIMEAVQAIAIREFGPKAAEDKRLFIISDLLQHTAGFSLYKQPPDVPSFRKTVYGQKLESDLRDVKAWIYLLHSKSGKQTDQLLQFWLDWLMLQGADLQAKFNVPG